MSGTPRFATVLVLLAGCATGLCAGCARGDVPCRPGFLRAADGHCYPPPPDPVAPSITDAVLATLPPCELVRPGDEIDWVAGCIQGACAGERFDTIDGALDRGADCRLNTSGTLWTCDWAKIEASFDVTDDGEVLPSGAATTDFIRVIDGYVGSTPEGLGMGLSVRCFLDVLGPPSNVELVTVTGPLTMQQAIWDPFGFEIEDEERADGEAFPDGLVDEITLTGSL